MVIAVSAFARFSRADLLTSKSVFGLEEDEGNDPIRKPQTHPADRPRILLRDPMIQFTKSSHH